MQAKWTGNEKTVWYQGREYIVFDAKSHPYTYVYVFADSHDSSKIVSFAYRRPDNPKNHRHNRRGVDYTCYRCPNV